MPTEGDFPTLKDYGIENLILDHNNMQQQQHVLSSVRINRSCSRPVLGGVSKVCIIVVVVFTTDIGCGTTKRGKVIKSTGIRNPEALPALCIALVDISGAQVPNISSMLDK